MGTPEERPESQPQSGTLDAVCQAFLTALDLPAGTDCSELAIGVTQGWDSLAHMTLVAELEERFSIALDTDDLIAISSFSAAIEVLRRYGVDV
jgi:hypothetical protein